jgi:hypothetical protein
VAPVALAENSIKARLEEASGGLGIEAGRVRDAFSVPACWSPAEPIEDARAESAEEVRRPFSELYTLCAVVGKGDKGFATLRGASIADERTTIYVGQAIDGHTLVELRGREAVFAGPEGRVTLELTTPALEQGAGQVPSDNTPGATPG